MSEDAAKLSPRLPAESSKAPDAKSPVTAASPPLLSPRGDRGNCVCCKLPMAKLVGTTCDEGWLHNQCVAKYQHTHVERCAHCERKLGSSRLITGGKKLHPECVDDYKAKKPFVPRSMRGLLEKFSIGKSLLGSKNWKERYFVVSEDTRALSYFESEADANKPNSKPQASIPLAKNTTRLITRPRPKHHPEAKNLSRDFIVVFHDDGKEHKLLCRAPTWQDQAAWCDVIADYILDVDSFLDEVE